MVIVRRKGGVQHPERDLGQVPKTRQGLEMVQAKLWLFRAGVRAVRRPHYHFPQVRWSSFLLDRAQYTGRTADKPEDALQIDDLHAFGSEHSSDEHESFRRGWYVFHRIQCLLRSPAIITTYISWSSAPGLSLEKQRFIGQGRINGVIAAVGANAKLWGE